MSLISEALRKAKQDAAERGAPSRGMVVRTTMTLPSRRSAGGGWALLGIVAAAVCAGALATWWLTGRARVTTGGPPTAAAEGSAIRLPERGAAPGAGPTAAPAAPPHGATTRGGSPVAVSVVGDHRSATPASPPVGSAPGATEAMPAAAAPEPAAAPPAVRSPQAEASPSSMSIAPPSPTRAAVTHVSPRSGGAERVFHLTADLGAVKLTIDYIAYRPGQAFAGINGERVVVGTVIDGVLVEEIGADFIALRDAKGPFLLRLH